MKKIKIVVVWHEGITETYHKFFKELSKYKDIDIYLIIPPYWPSEGGAIKGVFNNLFCRYKKFKFQKDYDPSYKILIKKVIFAGKSLHFYPSLFKTLSKINPDIIHAIEEPWTLCVLQIILWKKIFKKKTKIMFTTFENLSRKHTHLYNKWIEGFNLKHSDLAMTLDGGMKSILQNKGFKKEIQIIPGFAYLGVNTDVYKKMDVSNLKKQLSLNKFTIGYSGRFQKEKGVQVLLKAAAKLKQDYQLLLLGWGQYKPDIEILIKELGLSDKTRIIDEKLGSKIVSYLNCMDLLVVPSLTTPEWKEQFGRVVPEAMACEIPVIASDSGSLPYVIKDAGLIFKEGDVKDLKEKIELVMGDKKFRKALVKKGLKRAKQCYDSKKIASETYKLYKKIEKRPDQITQIL